MFLYSDIVSERIIERDQAENKSTTLQRLFNGIETGTTGKTVFSKYQKLVLDNMMNSERNRYKNVFGEKSKIFDQRERKIIKERVLECFFAGRQFFLDDKNKCRVTPCGYLDILSELKRGKTVAGIKIYQIKKYEIGKIHPIETIEQTDITINILYDIQYDAMKDKNLYYFEEINNECIIHVIQIKESVNDAIEFGKELADKNKWKNGSNSLGYNR